MARRGPSPDPTHVLRAHRSAVTSLAFHSVSGCLLSGDSDGELKIWDVVRRRPISSCRVHTATTGVIAIGTARYLENKIVSQSRDGTVKCWQLTEGGLSRNPLITLMTESYHFCKFSIPEMKSEEAETEYTNTQEDPKVVPSPGGGRALVAIVGEDPAVVEIWDLDGGKRVEQLRQTKCGNKNDLENTGATSSAAGMCMALHAFQTEPGGCLNVLSGYEDGSMALWDLRFPKMPRVNVRLHTEPVLSVKLDSSHGSGVSGAADNKLMMFSLENNENSIRVRKEIDLPRPGIADIAIRVDRKIFATAGWDHRVRVFDYRKRRPLAVLTYHAAAVTGVVFSEDQKLLVSSSEDTTIAIWSIYQPTEQLSARELT